MQVTLARRAAAEGLGTALLVAAVIGSGIMAQRLAGADVAVALLANTLATGGALIALLLAFGPISGAHLNPLVTLWAALGRELRGVEVGAYIAAQLTGALVGAMVANAMFDLPAISWSLTPRHGGGVWLSEAVATFGLIAVIIATSRHRPTTTPFAVAGYVVAAYWFTASTSFANPAVTLARAASDSFAGIRPADVPGFVAAQLLGASTAALTLRWLVPRPAAG